MRSVQTSACVHAQRGATSLPCLACGTPGSPSCFGWSFTLSPSCPPWLHGRYPLPGYYGDSDSCSAPSGTRAGILDYGACTSRHSVSNHPMRPRSPAMLLAPEGLGHRFAVDRYRRFFGLRSLLAVSSVASSRIEFVWQRSFASQFYGLSVHFRLLSTPCRHDAVAFGHRLVNRQPDGDFHPAMWVRSQAHHGAPDGACEARAVLKLPSWPD